VQSKPENKADKDEKKAHDPTDLGTGTDLERTRNFTFSHLVSASCFRPIAVVLFRTAVAKKGRKKGRSRKRMRKDQDKAHGEENAILITTLRRREMSYEEVSKKAEGKSSP